MKHATNRHFTKFCYNVQQVKVMSCLLVLWHCSRTHDSYGDIACWFFGTACTLMILMVTFYNNM